MSSILAMNATSVDSNPRPDFQIDWPLALTG